MSAPGASNPGGDEGIPRLPAQPGPLEFESLRARGLEMVQALSGLVWTDYNLHDPGVTLLESLCFALTEGVYEAETPVPALLAGPDGALDLATHGLHAAVEILPTRPVTREDLRGALRERVPGLERIDLEPSAGPVPGLWLLRTQAAIPHGEDAAVAARTAAAYLSVRNLGEDLAAWPAPLLTRECALEVALSVQGGRDVVDIFADVYALAARCVADGRRPPGPNPPWGGMDGPDPGLDLPELPGGPSAHPGRERATPPEDEGADRVFFGDLAHALAGVDGVAAVLSLRLVLAGQDAPGGSLPRRGEGWRLGLRLPSSPADLAGATAFWAGSPMDIPVEPLLARLARDLSAGTGTGAGAAGPSEGLEAPLLVPDGTPLTDAPYFPAQSHLPPLYQGASSPALTGYIALAEQWMAHAAAQRRGLGRLFSVDADPDRSYWWNMLEDAQSPGLEGLYLREPARIVQEVFAPLDDAGARRGRALDFLLALHGVELNQDRLRPFGVLHRPREWDAHLLGLKRRLVREIVPFTRDRLGGFDYSRPSLDVPDNTPVLQRWVGLELGLTELHSRSLTAAHAGQGLDLDGPHPASPHRFAGPARPPASWRPVDAAAGARRGGKTLLTDLARHVAPLRSDRLHPSFWRCAAHARRYWLAPEGRRVRLALGPDEDGHWWELASREGTGGAAELAEHARGLWDLAAALQRSSEGLHLVEHALLRPLRPSASGGDVGPGFYSRRLTAVFPAWTARCADASFRDLAADALARHAPLHLKTSCLWLEFADLGAFEALYRSWLDAKVAHCRQPEGAQALAALDQASRQLRLWLAGRGGGA